MEKEYMTPKGFSDMQAELKDLVDVQRPNIIQAISDARELGDLSENAEYHSAKEKQGLIEGKIKFLKGIFSSAEVIDPKNVSGDTVKFGATITVFDEDEDITRTLQIVGKHESNIETGTISFASPLAKAMIGKKAGDEVEFKAPSGKKYYEIKKVEYK